MPAPTTEERLQAVHERALERFDRAYVGQKEIRLQCMQDRRFVFVPGAQFDGDWGEQFANRPRIEFNKMQQAVNRTISEYRNNRISVDFRPADEDVSDDTADFLDGAYRADEQDSGGQEAYDTAFEEGVAGGFGAWRLRACYEDEEDPEDERQRIEMVPIPDADQSVFFDADARRYDKRDASCAWVITGLQDIDYDDEYGDADSEESSASTGRGDYDARKAMREGEITSFDKVSRTGIFDWFRPEMVYIAEYYEVEFKKDTVYIYRGRAGEEQKLKRGDYTAKEDFDAAAKDLKDQGFTLARTKKIKTRRVHKYIIDGNRVIEDCGLIAGKYIPIVPFYAKRQIVDGIERVSGRVRTAIDAQRLYNMLVSMLADIAADSTKEKPIFTPEQIAGHEPMWARDNIDRWAYLLVNATVDAQGQSLPAQPVAYTKAPNIPPALAGLIQLVGADLQELLALGGEQQEVVSNISAKAVELIQNRLDMNDFVTMDNMKQSVRWSGEIWLSMAQDIYDEDDRPMRVVKPDGTDEVKKLRQQTVGDDQATSYENDPKSGKFKVVADVGPSFTTRRDGTVRAITGMLQFVEDPADKAVLTGVAIQNLEGEGLQDVKKYWRHKMILAGVTEPTEEEAAQIAQAQAGQQKPDPQGLFLMASAKKADADARKSDATTQLTLQQINESQANIIKILDGIKGEQFQRLLQLADTLQPKPEPAEAVKA